MILSADVEEGIVIQSIQNLYVYWLNILSEEDIDNNAVSGMRFAVEDKHFVKCMWVTKLYGANCLLLFSVTEILHSYEMSEVIFDDFCQFL